MNLVLANVWAPKLPHHGATYAFDPDVDENGYAAYAAVLCRFAANLYPPKAAYFEKKGE